MRSVLCLAVLAACACAASTVVPTRDPEFTVRTLEKGRRLIPLSFQSGGFWQTSLRLPDLVLVNQGTRPVKLGAATVLGLAGGRELVRLAVPADEIAANVTKTNAKMKKALAVPAAKTQLAIAFGDLDAPEPEKLALAETMAAGQASVLLLSKLRFLEFRSEQKLETLRVGFSLDREGSLSVADFEMPLSYYEPKNAYTFPIDKAGVVMLNVPGNVAYHRPVPSQEFAIDAVVVETVNGALRMFRNEGKKLDDFFMYRREVRAMADGTVVEVGTRFAESATVLPFKPETFQALLKKLTPEIGFTNAMCGNYVIVEHPNGEFSFYAHLSEGSIAKRVGDAVKRGEVVGRVGSTGQSGAPHLHFHLMDGKDLLTAHSLPLVFTDVPAKAMHDDLKATNSVVSIDMVMPESVFPPPPP